MQQSDRDDAQLPSIEQDILDRSCNPFRNSNVGIFQQKVSQEYEELIDLHNKVLDLYRKGDVAKLQEFFERYAEKRHFLYFTDLEGNNILHKIASVEMYCPDKINVLKAHLSDFSLLMFRENIKGKTPSDVLGDSHTSQKMNSLFKQIENGFSSMKNDSQSLLSKNLNTLELINKMHITSESNSKAIFQNGNGKKDLDIIQYLQTHELHIYGRDNEGQTILHALAAYAKVGCNVAEITKFLQGKYKNLDRIVNISDYFGNTCIMSALKKGNKAAFWAFVKIPRIIFYANDTRGMTVLHIASIVKYYKIIKYINEQKRELKDIKDENGKTADDYVEKIYDNQYHLVVKEKLDKNLEIPQNIFDLKYIEREARLKHVENSFETINNIGGEFNDQEQYNYKSQLAGREHMYNLCVYGMRKLGKLSAYISRVIDQEKESGRG